MNTMHPIDSLLEIIRYKTTIKILKKTLYAWYKETFHFYFFVNKCIGELKNQCMCSVHSK